MLTRIVVLATLVGCYNPSVEPCRYACGGQDRACPEGLTCTANGMCAENETDTCTGEADGGTGSVMSVEVRDAVGDVVRGAHVVFSDAAGEELMDAVTDDNGNASFAMLPGGSVTVIHEVTRSDGVDYRVSTFLDLWPNASIVSQYATTKDMRPVQISFTPKPVAYDYNVYTSCTAGPLTAPSTGSLTVNVLKRCAQFDVVVIARPSMGTSGAVQSAALEQASGETAVVAAPYAPVVNVAGMVEQVPSNAVSAIVELGARVSSELPFIWGLTTPVATDGKGSVIWNAPQLPRATRVALSYMAGSDLVKQSVTTPFLATDTTTTVNLADDVIPWLTNPAASATDRTVSWTPVLPQGPAVADPDFVVSRIDYKHGTSEVTWNLFAPASRLGENAGRTTLVYPNLSGTRGFEPVGSDLVVPQEITLVETDDAAVHDMISTWQRRADDEDFFSIPGVTHLTLSKAPPRI